MDLQMADWKALRDQECNELRSKAPIAARFEDCSQLINRLCSTLSGSPAETEQVFLLAEECETKLKVWGHDTGANSRALDHALRSSSPLRTAILQHLTDLHEILQLGIDEIPPRYGVASDAVSSVGGKVPSLEDFDPQDDIDSDLDPDKYMDDAVEIMSCLSEMLPELRQPARDNLTIEWTEEGAATDLQMALEMFPNAPEFLKQRLAKANWVRRQRLKASGATTIGADHALGELHHAKQKTTSANNQASRLRRTRRALQRYRSRRGDSEAGISTIASTALDTVFSNGLFHSALGTSVAETQDSPATRFKVPDPPVKLSSGLSFNCPYCLFELPLDLQNITEKDWSNHVFLDIEPYICTFDHCLHAHKTFGSQEEWFQHETCEHRLQKVWVCHSPTCLKEFSSEVLFHDHLLASHADLFPSTDLSAAVIDAFKGLSHPVMRTNLCALCLASFRDAAKLKDHVANHLEQFGLTAIYFQEDSDDDASDGGDDKMEGPSQPSELLLGQYVAEQASIYELARSDLPEVQVDHQYKLAWKNLQPLRPTFGATEARTVDSSDMADNGEDQPPRKEKDDWENRVNIFLEDKRETEDHESISQVTDELVRFNRPPRSVEFVGRKDSLDRLHAVLSKPGQIGLMSGRGGIGKTATAVEYSYKFESEYSAIFWIEAETAGGCANKYAQIAENLGIVSDSKRGEAALINLAREYLSTTERTFLIVFDNVEEWSDILPYIPRNMPKTNGSILITARETNFWPRTSRNYFHFNLDILPLEEATSLLLKSMQSSSSEEDWSKHPDYALAAEASRLVGQLPLAVSMVAGYLKVSRCPIEEFLETWEEREEMSKKKKKSKPVSQGFVDAAIDSLWDIGIGELSLKARSLLDILSFLDPEAIPKDLLVGDHTEEALEFLNSAETIRYKRMIDQLSGRKLIAVVRDETGNETYSIHRLLQTKILSDMDSYKIGETFGYKFSETFQSALFLIRKKYPPASPIQVPEPAKWADCEKYMLHVSSLHRIYQEYNHTKRIWPTLNLAELFYNAGFHVWERQTTAYDGLSFLKCAEEQLDAIDFDPNGKLRADIHSIAGIYYNGAGSAFRDESIRKAQAALRIRQVIYESNPEDNDSDVLLRNAANDLASCLLNKNEYEEAGKLLEGCLEQYRTWGTEDDIPFEYAKYYNCNAFVQMRHGNYQDAIESMEKCVELAAKHSTQTWQYWQYKFSLACIIHQSGNSQKALEIHLETLNGRLDLFGQHDQNTIFSTYAVGAMYHHLKAVPTAIDYMIECIECARTSKFPEEALGRAQLHLSKMFREQGIEEEDAKKLEADALKVLGEYSQYASDFLKGVEDPMTLFDDLQSIFDGRFTGRQLLKYMQGVSDVSQSAKPVA